MFTKMEKFCILAFAILSVLLLFADANGYHESDLRQQATATATTTPTAIASATAKMDEQAVDGEGGVARIFETQKTAAATQTLLTATTTATAAAAATMATTVTLASSNAPATLTTTNDVDERVLSTTKPAATAAELETDGQAKPQLQQQVKQQQASDENMRKKQKVLLYSAEPTTTTTTPITTTTTAATTIVTFKINAATLATTSPTPTNRATAGGATTKITEVPNGNFESKSRADTLPLHNGATMRHGDNAGLATIQPKGDGNEAHKTQIIKNAKELHGNGLNEQEQMQAAHELSAGEARWGERAEKVTEGSVVAGEELIGVTARVLQSPLKTQQDSAEFEVLKPHEDTRTTITTTAAGWTKPTTNKNKQETKATDNGTMHSKFSAETVEKLVSIENKTTTPKITIEPTANSQPAYNAKTNIPQQHEHSIYRIKLAEIVTDEYENGSGREEDEGRHEFKHESEQVKTAGFASTTDDISETTKKVANQDVKPEMNAKGWTITTTNLPNQKQSDKIVERLASQAVIEEVEQKNHEKLIKQYELPHENEQAHAKQEEEQSKSKQLRREQEANKELMDSWQVQKEYIVSELNEDESNKNNNKGENNDNNTNNSDSNNDSTDRNNTSNQQQNTNNNPNKNIYSENTNKKTYEQSDHVENTIATLTTTTTTTTISPHSAASTSEPTLGHIDDLYPMRKEDFNTIIRDSNEKLLKERTIYKPTEHSGIVELQQQQIEPADILYGQRVVEQQMVRTEDDADDVEVAEVRHQHNLLANEVDGMSYNVLQRYDNINNLAAAQWNNKHTPITTETTATKLNEVGMRERRGEKEKEAAEETTDVNHEQDIWRGEGNVKEEEMRQETGLKQDLGMQQKSSQWKEIEQWKETEVRKDSGQRQKQNLNPTQGQETEGRQEPEQWKKSTQRQEPTQRQADTISDFTGKLLAEQDGVITEIEQKFRLNEFAAAPITATATALTATEAEITTAKTTSPTKTNTATKISPSVTTTKDNERLANNGKSVSYTVNHKMQQTSKGLKNKYISSNSNSNNKNNKGLPPPLPSQPRQYDFIERRVKKSFDFPMHRAASASDTLQMPHVDFANTKFNTGTVSATNTQMLNGAAHGGATQDTSGSVSGSGSGMAMRAALGTHPEFSTTKFYNSKELYNEMMQHNRQRLKAKAKEEEQKMAATGIRIATINATNYTQAPKAISDGSVDGERSEIRATASSRFTLSQSSKLETSKYVPGAAASKPIMPTAVHMNSQQWVNGEIAARRSVVDMRTSKDNVLVAEVGEKVGGNGAQNDVEAKSAERKMVAKKEESQKMYQQEMHAMRSKQDEQQLNVQKDADQFTSYTTASTAYASENDGEDKRTKKYQKQFNRAKLLIKSLMLPINGNKANATAATHTATGYVAANPTNATANSENVKQFNLDAPSRILTGAATQKPATTFDTAIAPSSIDDVVIADDLLATHKTFDIMSLRHKTNIVMPSIATREVAMGNIDDSINTDSTANRKEQMWPSKTKWVNFNDNAMIAVKRAKSSAVTTTRITPVTATKTTATNRANSMSTTTRFTAPSSPSTSTSATTNTPSLDDPTTTPLPLIYPYPQLLHRTNVARLLSQPHDTTAAAISSTTTTTTTTTTTRPSTIPFAYHPSASTTSTSTTTTNHSKSPSKPIVRPRILSRLQEKINSLECEIQNVPSDSHLWRGNETHELLLPIMTSENCPYGGTDCSPLLVSWEGEAEIQSGDILIVEINDTLLALTEHNMTNTSPAHNIQVYQVTRSGHEHCDVTEGILLDITPLMVDGRKLVTLYDKDLTEGVNLLIVVSELWGSQCVRLKVTTKTDNCGENAECSGKGVCYSNAVMEEYECQCCSGFAGPHCEEIDACTPSPCTNNGICVDLSQGHEGNSYQCLCPYGYTGKNCQYESDPCNSAECMNGGSCVGNSTHFRCDCTPGYTGPLCQHSLNECESSPCVHGICVDQEDGFRCFCQPGFAGELCNFEYNECESNPCQNDGECIDHIGNFECRCTKGYTGTRCQIKVDFCANKPCPDGHRCIDHGNDFSCECPGGNNGLDCNQMPRKQCIENLCKHGGTCWTSGASFYCACRPGYTGNMCEDEFVVETVVSSSEFMVDDTSARNFNDKTFGSSVVLKSPIELHNAYFGAGVLAAAVFIVAVVVTICHCKVNQTYRKFSTRSTTFFPILGFGRRSKSQNKLNKHWLSGKGLGGGGGGGGSGIGSSSLRSSGSTTSLTRGHLPSAHSTTGGHHSQQQRQQQLQQQQMGGGGQMHERPFQRHLAMNLENDMYYTVDFSENSQHSPLIQ